MPKYDNNNRKSFVDAIKRRASGVFNKPKSVGVGKKDLNLFGEESQHDVEVQNPVYSSEDKRIIERIYELLKEDGKTDEDKNIGLIFERFIEKGYSSEEGTQTMRRMISDKYDLDYSEGGSKNNKEILKLLDQLVSRHKTEPTTNKRPGIY